MNLSQLQCNQHSNDNYHDMIKLRNFRIFHQLSVLSKIFGKCNICD